jgi:hypothetical protein
MRSTSLSRDKISCSLVVLRVFVRMVTGGMELIVLHRNMIVSLSKRFNQRCASQPGNDWTDDKKATGSVSNTGK